MGVIGVKITLHPLHLIIAPLNKDEVKELYLKLRASGDDHTANVFHRSIGHSSLSTLQRFVNSMH